MQHWCNKNINNNNLKTKTTYLNTNNNNINYLKIKIFHYFIIIIIICHYIETIASSTLNYAKQITPLSTKFITSSKHWEQQQRQQLIHYCNYSKLTPTTNAFNNKFYSDVTNRKVLIQKRNVQSKWKKYSKIVARRSISQYKTESYQPSLNTMIDWPMTTASYHRPLPYTSWVDKQKNTALRPQINRHFNSRRKIHHSKLLRGKGAHKSWMRRHRTSSNYFSSIESNELDLELDCSMYPNNTYTMPFAYSCDTVDEETPSTFTVHEVAFSNETGDYVYPLDFTQTVRIFLDLTSYATRRYESLRAEVKIFRRKVGWLGCGWVFVPSFGSLDTLEVCDTENPSCPIYPGRQVLEMQIEPSPVLNGFLKMFYNDRNPFQLEVRLINNRQMGEELLCVMFQSRIDM